MNRPLLAVLFAAIAIGAWIFGARLPGGFRISGSGPITVIETEAAPTPMEAALVLRAILRFDPQSITFVDPLDGADGEPLLRSRLADTRIPVTFAPPAPAAGTPRVSADRLPFDRLLLRIERSERGEVALDLDALFRGRPVYVETAGTDRAPALATRIEPARPVNWPGVFGVLLAASLPWWPLRRHNRALLALAVASAWMLAAVSVQREFDVAIPIAFAPLLPLLALIPPGRPRVVSH